jgi:peptidoglycan L-alanyl-D-glutamate endopeptidase CwlK
MAVLRQGSKGAEVRNLQMVLQELGFGVTPDGDFGRRTHDAVVAAQRAMGLTADGVVGPKTWDGLDAAYQPGVDNFTSSGQLNPVQVAEVERPIPAPTEPAGHARLSGVHPALVGRAMALIGMAAADGQTIRVSQGLRSFAEQDRLFAQGRTKPGPRVTNARGGQSLHNYGLAVDFVFLVGGRVSWERGLYDQLGPWCSRIGGLEWGGSWARFRDAPHVQLAGLPGTASLLGVYTVAGKGRSGITAVWRHLAIN